MTKEELENLKRTVDYFGHWYDVIGEERIVILEKSIDYIDALEQEKCELLGIIQGKDKVIQDLKEDNKVMSNNYSKMEQKFYDNLSKAKEIIRQLCLMVRELNKPNVQLTNVDYSLSEAEEFLKEKL